MDKLKIDANILCCLTMRNTKIFIKDKLSVFFSMLGPMIILLLYVLFLADIQVSSLESFVPEGVPYEPKVFKSFINAWMVSGIMGLACLTVSFSANTIIVQDKQRGVLNDALIAPLKKGLVTISYFISNFIITLIMVLATFVVCLIYIAVSGWYLSVADILVVIANTVLSVLSATLFSVFISNLLNSEAQHGAITGILSSVVGFLIGAYMPMSIMPKAAQYISALIPGAYSTGIFRNYLMRGSLEKMAETLPKEAIDAIKSYYTMEINMFGKTAELPIMFLILALSIVIFFAINIVMSILKKNK